MLRKILRWPLSYWRRGWWQKTICTIFIGGTITLGAMYGVGEWYIRSETGKPTVLGTSFIADYATSLGLDPHQAFSAILDNLGVRHVRLVSYWSDIERTSGAYDFSELDWEFRQVDARGGHISLAIGLRQPRWPECHMPKWASDEPANVWRPRLGQFMTAVINRYKNNPALESYQLENEYHLTWFATCADQSTSRLVDEAKLVHRLDPKHVLITSRSDNLLEYHLDAPVPDEYAVAIYRRVWTPIIRRYIQYPWPSSYYSFLAGAEKLMTGHNTVVHELQTEPWPPYSMPLTHVALTEQNKSFDAKRLKSSVAFAKATGMKTIDLWGAEYWYYRKVTLHDPSVWNAAQQEYQAVNRQL